MEFKLKTDVHPNLIAHRRAQFLQQQQRVYEVKRLDRCLKVLERNSSGE
jgi:hypothetical protein